MSERPPPPPPQAVADGLAAAAGQTSGPADGLLPAATASVPATLPSSSPPAATLPSPSPPAATLPSPSPPAAALPSRPSPTPPVASVHRGSHGRGLLRLLPRGRGGQPSSIPSRGLSDARAQGPQGRGSLQASGHPAGAASRLRGRASRGQNNSYNKNCAKCNQVEANSKKRFKLCNDDTGCRRWVHKTGCLHEFNTFAPESERCCSHRSSCKSRCCCKMCNERRRTSRAGGRGGIGGGRGGAAPQNGSGRGHGAHNGQGRGHAGRVGWRGVAKQRQRVFILPLGKDDKSLTVAVRLGNADNWVITSVNPERRTSSCSRTVCQGLRAGLVAQQQAVAGNGGVASALGGLCKHATAALEHIANKKAIGAKQVKGDGWDLAAAKEHVAKAKGDGHLSPDQYNAIMTMIALSEESAVWPVYETETNHYVVRDGRTRTSEHDYACVKNDTVSQDKSRRVTPARMLMCRAVKGEACTEYKDRKRTCCVHTLIVAIFARLGQNSTASSDTGEGGAADGSSDDPVLPRTPRVLLAEDAALYDSRLQDSLVYMSRLKFPPARPSGLVKVEAEPGRRFTVSQTRCTCGGDLLSEGDVDARLVTEAPLVSSVVVERKKCGACGTCAWASDNWRETAVFNFNNYYLLSVSLLYMCRAHFIGGTPIQSFFFAHFAALMTDIGWLSENPDFAASIADKNSRFFVQLTNAFLAFLGLTDFSFEFRCFLWGSRPDVLTADACVKMSVNQMTTFLAKMSRHETILNFDMSMACLKLSLVSSVFFGGERVQFVLGDLEAVGRTPAWVSPDNRLFERGVKTPRAVVEPPKYKFDDGQRTKLMDALNENGEGGIGQLGGMNMEALKQLHFKVFGRSGSSLRRKEELVAKFQALFEDGDCSKLFHGGRGGVATAGMVCVFTPAGVMVAWKVLPTPESVYDVVDFVTWLKKKPVFLCYDAACKLVAGLNKRCPGLLDNDGILLRDAAGNVVFPELAHVGNNRDSATRDVEPCTLFEDRKRTTDTEDMYAVMETAASRPGLQSEVDSHEALFLAAAFSKQAGVGELSKLAATRALDALHRDGVRILSLFEVLVFTYHWHRKAAEGAAGGAAGSVTGGIVLGANGWGVYAPGGGEEGGGGGDGGGATHAQARDFLLPVLVGLSGSRQASKVSALPLWVDDKLTSEEELEAGLRGYAKAMEDFIVNGTKPLTQQAQRRAGIAARGGIGFGRSPFSLKLLELRLAQNAAPHETTTDDKVAGYDAIFHDTRYEGTEEEPFPRKMRIGPDGHHESNHGPECRAKYSGMTTCKDFAGVNLTRHESDHGVKAVYFRSINNMTFPNFTYSLSVINELQNRKYNKQFLGVLLEGINGHKSTPGCHGALWSCGRCFCGNPLVRVFNCFGVLDLVFLTTVLSS